MLTNLQNLQCFVSSVQSYLNSPTFNLVAIQDLTNKKCPQNKFLPLQLTLTMKLTVRLREQCYENVLVLPTSKWAAQKSQFPHICWKKKKRKGSFHETRYQQNKG